MYPCWALLTLTVLLICRLPRRQGDRLQERVQHLGAPRGWRAGRLPLREAALWLTLAFISFEGRQTHAVLQTPDFMEEGLQSLPGLGNKDGFQARCIDSALCGSLRPRRSTVPATMCASTWSGERRGPGQAQAAGRPAAAHASTHVHCRLPPPTTLWLCAALVCLLVGQFLSYCALICLCSQALHLPSFTPSALLATKFSPPAYPNAAHTPHCSRPPPCKRRPQPLPRCFLERLPWTPPHHPVLHT